LPAKKQEPRPWSVVWHDSTFVYTTKTGGEGPKSSKTVTRKHAFSNRIEKKTKKKEEEEKEEKR